MQGESYVIKQSINKTSLWKDKAPLLGRLDMELTERCNNNCLHCCINLPQDDREAKKKELSSKEIKRILKEAAALGCMSVRFTGGEPLLREDFKDLYVFARRQGLKVLIFTNATLITPALAELLANIPPLEKIEVSLYGMRKSSYEAVTRTPGSFIMAWRGINLLLEKKVAFVVKSVLLPQNKDEIDEFEAWAATIPWMDKKPSYSLHFDLRCRRDLARNKLIIENRLSSEEGLKIIARNKDAYFKEMKEFCGKFMGPADDKLFSCGSGMRGGCVDAYGFFQPCMMVRHPDTVYNLREGTLKDALVNFFPKVRQMKALNADYLLRCAKCFLKGFCEQCPAKSWAEHGTLDTPVEYFCQVAHTQAKFLGLLKEGEKAWEVKDWKERIEEFTGSEPVHRK